MTLRGVTAIVLARNRWRLTKGCLDTLRQTDLSGTEVLVVDHGSTDETPRELPAYSWVRVLRTNVSNCGCGQAWNVGIGAAAPDSDVVLLTNDLEFPQRDWVQRLRLSAHSRPEAAIVGCRLRLHDGRLLHAGAFILPDDCWSRPVGLLQKDIGQYPGLREVESVSFAGAYIRREAIRAVGGLSEDYESVFADADYALRAREKGFKTFVDGGVTLAHHGLDANSDREALRHSREIFRRAWAAKLEARYTRELLWQSIINFPTGYAASCREILRALDERGVRLIYRYVYGPGSPSPAKEADSSNDDLLDALRLRGAPTRPPLAVVYGQGDVFHRNVGRCKVGFTMLEVDGFPRDWVEQANGMDEVWVPSEFNRQGFVESGLRRPIHTIPLGVDPSFFHPRIIGYPNPAGEFVFLSIFEWSERKQPSLLLRAFQDAFRASERVRLLCKIINIDPAVHVLEEIRRLELKPDAGRVSFIINRDFPYYQLGSFYRSADCYVSAGHGEGWNMPLIEAMACGLPTIATDWGAHTEFVHAGISYPLRVRKTIPAIARSRYYEGHRWADPDPEHLRFLLRHVYENQDEARSKGAAASAEVTEKWTWDHTARRILARLDELAPDASPRRREPGRTP
ncbi:MAG TPA: glycosyltransferase [Thermoanaerobaculia bacterium]|nr:glycosyltransferase [Thermoanaerobaculia bacterium]